MQKKIIALAIAAAFSAPAMAEVTVYGILDAAVASVSADNMKGDILPLSSGAAGSRIGVTGVEDIGNGMKAVVKLEYALDIETKDTLTSTRQEMLAVAGNFGTVATGYLQTTAFDFGLKYDPLGGSAVSPLQVVTKGGGFIVGTVAAGARAERALAYISPDMGGLVAAVNWSSDFTGGLGNAASAADTKRSAYLVSANYTAGPLAVGGVYAATLDEDTIANRASEFAVGVAYDLGMAKVMGTYQSVTPDGGDAQNAISFSGVMPMGGGAVAASYAFSDMSAANSNGSSFTVGYLHTLSKTTTAYAAFQSVSQDSATKAYSVGNNVYGALLANGASSTLIAAGIKKVF